MGSATAQLSTVSLQRLFDIVPTGIIVIDGQGRVSRHNQAALGLLGEPLLGQTWISIIQRAFSPRSDDGCEISLRDGRRVNINLRSLAPEPGEIITVTDLTATRDWQEEQRLNTMGRMTAHLAHQIRTPLASALLYSRNAQKPDLSSAQRDKFQQKIIRCLHDIEQQISDMLSFAKGGESIVEAITLGELFQHITQKADAIIQESQCRFSIDNPIAELPLTCHAEALQGALLNLINNAIQASETPAHVCLKARWFDAGILQLSVSDQGKGMSATEIEKVKQPFYTTRAQGTGLGLAVVQAVAKAHNGEVVIQSQEGVGTQISLLIRMIGDE